MNFNCLKYNRERKQKYYNQKKKYENYHGNQQAPDNG